MKLPSLLTAISLLTACSGGGGGYTALTEGGGNGGDSGGSGGGTSSATKLISAGYDHTCGRLSGTIYCWGDNVYGLIGDGTTVNRPTPTAVLNLGNEIDALAVGITHSCALNHSGGVKCWGRTFYGQLGDGGVGNGQTPVSVTGLSSGVTSVVSGDGFSCALLSTGGVKCWGKNAEGQLGDGTTTNSNVPVNVSGLSSGVTSLTAHDGHTCAMINDGSVKCWGRNNSGIDASGSNKTSPVAMASLNGVVASMAVGDSFGCFVTTSNGAKCWGVAGALGNGVMANSLTPVDVTGYTSGVSSIAVGSSHACLITSAGAVKCWGKNSDGQLGDGTNTDQLSPVAVTGLGSGVVALSLGARHSCALKDTGNAVCWGYNLSGQIGDGTASDPYYPQAVAGYTTASKVSVGNYYACSVSTAGGVKCWGYNGYGQLGDSTTTSRNTAADVTGLTSGVSKVVTSLGTTCALTTGGGVKCWGRSAHGEVGDGFALNRSSPANVSGLSSGVADISAGDTSVCALTTGGAVKCWGYNPYGELGNGTTTDSNVPVNVTGLGSGVTAIGSGSNHNCAVVTGGTAVCWGKNDQSQLGDGTTTNRNTPVSVGGLTSLTSITGGYAHTCATNSSGSMKCWGYNAMGQLGDGTTSFSPVTSPTTVSTLTNVSGMSANTYNTCAVQSQGLYCWGSNSSGQLGTGNTTNASSPTAVSGLGSGVIHHAMGYLSGCAVTSSNIAKCWGLNNFGQLGHEVNVKTPTAVLGF